MLFPTGPHWDLGVVGPMWAGSSDSLVDLWLPYVSYPLSCLSVGPPMLHTAETAALSTGYSSTKSLILSLDWQQLAFDFRVPDTSESELLAGY